jgi:hypothetical protein
MQSLNNFAGFGNSHRVEMAHKPRAAAKLPKHTIEATCVLTFFAIAAGERISEKNPAFRLISINGPVT